MDDQLTTLTATGQIDPQAAGLLAMLQTDSRQARPGETALRTVERRLAAQFMAHMAELAGRVSAGVEENEHG